MSINMCVCLCLHIMSLCMYVSKAHIYIGSVRFRVRFRPVPELNGSVRFGSVRPVGSVSYSFLPSGKQRSVDAPDPSPPGQLSGCPLGLLASAAGAKATVQTKQYNIKQA